MHQKYHWISTVFAGFFLFLALLAWIYFAPIRLGGQNEYILISGRSMEPRIQPNDLIVVQQEDVYKIGDAVAYRNPILNVVVFHRIVGQALDRFIVKGDNNTWADSYNPTKADLVGKEWAHIANVGKIVVLFRQPLLLAIIVALIGGITLGFLFFNSKKKKNAKNPQPAANFKSITQHIRSFFSHTYKTSQNMVRPGSPPYPDSRQERSTQLIKAREMNGTIEIVFLVLGFLVILSLALGLFGFLNPVMHQTTLQTPYQQTGSYSYTASAPAGVYDTQILRSGDPVFTKLTCSLNLSYNYLLLGEGLNAISGTHQLTAVLSDPASGWTRIIPLEQQ